MASLSDVLRSVFKTYDSDTVLDVTEVIVDSWNDLVMEVKNTYAEVKGIVTEEAGIKGQDIKVYTTDEHVEFVEAFPDDDDDAFALTREDKIEYIRKWFKEVNPSYSGAWFSDPVPYGDSTVNKIYAQIERKRSDRELREKQALDNLRTAVAGDRFGPVHIDPRFNPRDYWKK